MSVKVESAQGGLGKSTVNVGLQAEPGRQNPLPGGQTEIPKAVFKGRVAGSDDTFAGPGIADRRQSPFFLPTVGGQPRTEGTFGVIDPALSLKPDRVDPFGDIMATEVKLGEINAKDTSTNLGTTAPGGHRDTMTDK